MNLLTVKMLAMAKASTSPAITAQRVLGDSIRAAMLGVMALWILVPLAFGALVFCRRPI